MIPRIIQFIKYNNFFTLILMVLVLGSGVTFAASPAAQGGIVKAEETVSSIDNSYIINANLALHDFSLKVTNVTEDPTNYYVSYSYTTIGLIDGAWQNVPVQKTLTVDKKSLSGQDLGLFVSVQLGQIIDSQVAYLTSVQAIERNNGQTRKVVSTTYSGLIGSMLSPKEKVFEGYDPVVKPVAPELDQNVSLASSASSLEPESQRSKSIPRGEQPVVQSNASYNPDPIRQTVNDLVSHVPPSTEATSTPAVAPVVPPVATSTDPGGAATSSDPVATSTSPVPPQSPEPVASTTSPEIVTPPLSPEPSPETTPPPSVPPEPTPPVSEEVPPAPTP